MSAYPYLVSSRFLHSAIDVLLACNVKPTVVLKRLNVSPSMILDPNAWIPNRLVPTLVTEAVRATGNPLYAHQAAQQFCFERAGSWGESILKAQTVRAGFQACIRNIRLLQTDCVFRLHEEGNTAYFSLQILGHGPEDARAYYEAFGIEFQKIPALSGEQLPITVWLKHGRPRNASEMERFIGPSLRFNAPEYALVFDREFLDLPLKNRLIESPSAQPVGQWPNPDPVARATMGMIAEHIQYEAPTIQTTAAALGLQIRTFQRRLEQWGTTFESLLDDFRRERACALLQSGTCTIIEVAFRLGYSDSAHFTRAFHRWMGMAPREYLLRNHQRDHEAPHAKGRVLPSLFCS